jgi:hypothetical protein
VKRTTEARRSTEGHGEDKRAERREATKGREKKGNHKDTKGHKGAQSKQQASRGLTPKASALVALSL